MMKPTNKEIMKIKTNKDVGYLDAMAHAERILKTEDLKL